MVGDGAGDRLANPPRGVGAELVAAAVFVLVHRPHQAGVAFLDEVQERQAAVAVLLGDGDDQPQVAAGELALGLFVLVEDAARSPRRACASARGSSSTRSSRPSSSSCMTSRSSAVVASSCFAASSMRLLQLDHLVGDRAGASSSAAGSLLVRRRQLFEQLGDLAAAALHGRCDALRARPRRSCRPRAAVPVVAVALEQLADGAEVGGNALGDRVLVDRPRRWRSSSCGRRAGRRRAPAAGSRPPGCRQ